jgi:sec-independent protein translocase protein TatC
VVEQIGDSLSSRMTLWEHLRELRGRVFKAVIAVAVGAVIMWIAYPWVEDIMREPLDKACTQTDSSTDCAFVITDVLGGLSARLAVSGYGGIAFAMPVILWQLWRFITPGLYPNEKRMAIPFMASSLLLFVLGATMAYYVLPRGLVFLLTIAGDDVEPLLDPKEYFSFLVYMMLAFGVGFLFPVILVFLQLLGLLQPETLAQYRRHAMVGIMIVVAVITPSGDPFTLLALSIPMYIFYEASIHIGKLMRRRRQRATAGA